LPLASAFAEEHDAVAPHAHRLSTLMVSLDDLSKIEPLRGPALSLEDMKRLGRTTPGKLILGATGTYLLVRLVSATGAGLKPKNPDEVARLDDPPGVFS